MKDYVLTKLFVKYSRPLYRSPLCGDRLNKIISKLVEANSLSGIIDVADFDDDPCLLVDKKKLISCPIWCPFFINEALNFRRNRVGPDHVLVE